MDDIANGAPYVGVSVGGLDGATSLSPLTIKSHIIRDSASQNKQGDKHVLEELSQEQILSLGAYLDGRLTAGAMARNKRIRRYARIDRTVSTWQKLDPEESKREQTEDASGKQMALPVNLPVLASHLNDMVSYFAEALAPIANPFFSASGEGKAVKLLEKFNRDALARDYYGELSLTLRALLKYNLGGFIVDWDPGSQPGEASNQPGNRWKSADMYNVLWDPSIRKPARISADAEWGASVTIENRLTLMRKSLKGQWVGLEQILESGAGTTARARFYKEAAVEASLGEEGQDSHTSSANSGASSPNWNAFGIGLVSDLGPEVDGFEVVDMFCWLVPAQFGLLTDSERDEIKRSNVDPETFIELWRFKIVGGSYLVDAHPVIQREMSTAGESVQIPLYLANLTQDQIMEAQRSFMELMRGFQRFASAMFNIYIAGMRKNVWGLKGVDPAMFDTSRLKTGDTVGVMESKQPGRDVRSGMMTLDSSAGVENALSSVGTTLELKNQFFPSQALPSQIAGIDRAVKSQVATVIQGAQRSLRNLLRTLDSSLMLPTRLAAFRNLKRFDSQGIEDMTDEEVAKLLGSGIESMEAERVAEALWNLLHAVIQNQESMQVFNVPLLMTYLSRVMNLSVDLGQFVRQQEPAAAPAGGVQPEAQAAPPAGA